MKIKPLVLRALLSLLLVSSFTTQATPLGATAIGGEPADNLVQVEWSVEPSKKISEAEKTALLEHLRLALLAALPNDQPAVRPLKIRAHITAVDTVSPALNTASALLLFLPFDRGGASVEIQAVDLNTGEQVASMTKSYSPSMRKMRARFKKLAPAQLALEELASVFSAQLALARTQ
ncbi:DUF3313 family protein [Noviluteimonas gilva]|uniref:DUF3313 family protein n=1 Tax=Noviluteimonas gilva TaxID=2682097 RepID=A0A7C9I7G2_9GAMM|nr:DUF3313 family protein [Lysobacter gilvus]MUV15669.1 DUF3313 family protein [Lysobacter gilvus]